MSPPPFGRASVKTVRPPRSPDSRNGRAAGRPPCRTGLRECRPRRYGTRPPRRSTARLSSSAPLVALQLDDLAHLAFECGMRSRRRAARRRAGRAPSSARHVRIRSRRAAAAPRFRSSDRIRSCVARLATNSPLSSAKAAESLKPSLEKPTIGGAPTKAVEETVRGEIDPAVSARVEIQPIGRGATIALNGSCGSSVLSRARGFVEHCASPLRPETGRDDIGERRPRAILRREPSVARYARSRRSARVRRGRSPRGNARHRRTIR